MPKSLKKSDRTSRMSKYQSTDNENTPLEKYVEIPVKGNERNRIMALVDRVEGVVLNMVQQINSGVLPNMTNSMPTDQPVPKNVTSTNDEISEPEIDETNACDVDDDRSLASDDIQDLFDPSSNTVIQDEEEVKSKTIPEKLQRKERTAATVSYACKKSRSKLTLMATVLAHSHHLMTTGSTMTRRSLFYRLHGGPTSGLAPSQRYVDDSVDHVSSVLDCAPWDLGFVATSKGLMSGDLHLTLSDSESCIDCTVPGGVLVPQNIQNVTSIRSTASSVILVEKDAIFQKLLEEDCPRFLNCVLVTGKGYPDVVTRMLVKLLRERLDLPVYALVDADPFGMDIMCVYRFGSVARSRQCQDLVCPDIKWLGIRPSELTAFGVQPKPLTDADSAKLKALENRPYMNLDLLKELEDMKTIGKAEIESVAGFSQRFLTTVYLPCKIKSKDYV